MMAQAPAFAQEEEAALAGSTDLAAREIPQVIPPDISPDIMQELAEEPDLTPLPTEPSEPSAEAIEILGEYVEPGTIARLVLLSSESFAGARLETPVIVVHGVEPGPALCLVAGIHGDEVNGVEIVRRTLMTLDVETLKGSIIAIPIANPSAFLRGSRYLPDRRDLNRFFPGSPRGSAASRIAYRLFEGVIRSCDALVDLHTGSFDRTNVHQLRANLAHESTAALAAAFGTDVVVNNAARQGTLRRAAMDIGIPAITLESGAPRRFEQVHVDEAVDGVAHLLSARGMVLSPQIRAPRPEATAYLRTRWIRCNQGGILVSQVELGDTVEMDQLLGTISDPLSEDVEYILSPIEGRLIGMALDQLVMPGFGAYHIGYEPRALGPRLRKMSGDAEEALEDAEASEDALEDYPEGVDLGERPE